MIQPITDVTQTAIGTTPLTESECHGLLRVERRRVTLDVLADRTAPIDLEDLAETVATRERGGVDEEFIECVMISLHHSHLPKMADLGVIEYDPDAARIESCPPHPGPGTGHQ